MDEHHPKELAIQNKFYVMQHQRTALCSADQLHQRTWYNTKQQIGEDWLIRNVYNMTTNITFDLSKLKRLAICGDLSTWCNHPEFKGIDFRVLNQFKLLEHLEVLSVFLWKEERLSLPNLRVLSLFSIDRASSRPLTVDAPQLNVLNNGAGLDYVEFDHPETIKELRVHFDGQRLERFVNVEVFTFDRPASIDRNIVQQFPKLKRLHFEEDKFETTDYEQIKVLMMAVLEHEKVTSGELKVFFLSTPLDKPRKRFDDYELFFEYDIFGSSADHMLELDEFDGFDAFDEYDEEYDDFEEYYEAEEEIDEFEKADDFEDAGDFDGVDDFEGLDDFEDLDDLEGVH